MAMVDSVRARMMAAMKEKDTQLKDVLSSLLAALKDGVIKKRADLTQEEEFAIIAKELKQTKETMEAAPKDRTDIIDECAFKIKVLSAYLPEQMDEQAIRAAIEGVLAKLGISAPAPKDKGIIMRELMPLVKGKADGAKVSELLGTYLAG